MTKWADGLTHVTNQTMRHMPSTDMSTVSERGVELVAQSLNQSLGVLPLHAKQNRGPTMELLHIVSTVIR